MSETSEGSKRDMPLWAGIAIISLGVLIAGWFIWSQVSGFWSGPSGVFQIPGVDPNAVQRAPRQAMRAQRPTAVREINKGEWRVRAVPYSLIVREADGKQSVVLNVSSTRLLPPDAQWVLVTKPRLDATTAQQLGLTEAQVRRFKGLPTSMAHRLNPSAEQTQQLQQAFKKWREASPTEKEAVDREVSDLTTKIGQTLLPATQAELAKAYEDAKREITPEKWAKLKSMGTSAPAAQP